jgi:hypothetical protein
MKKNMEMGLAGDYDGVDFFGLDEFGMPAGMNPLWGALAGAGIQSGTAIAVRAFTDMDDWSEAIGAGAGIAAGGVMAIFSGTRAAGWTAMAVSLVSGGLRTLEKLFSDKEKAKSTVAGYGIPVVDRAFPVNGLGQIDVRPLGIATVEPGMMPGQMSGADAQLLGANPQLLGANPQLLGGPAISGLGAHYGATIFGSR